MFSPSLSAEDLDHVLTHTRDSWEQLRNQRVFITGGTGFFGRWLIESFLWANEKLDLHAEAVALSRNPEAFRCASPHLASQPALSFRTGSIEQFAFPEGRFSHVIHAATAFSSRLPEADQLGAFDRDVQGTRRVLEFARQCGAKRLLLTSSGAVYGRQPSDLTHIPEEYVGGPDATAPRTAYGQAKRASEFLSASYAREFGLEAVIARCFAFVGPYLPLDADFAIGNFLRDALAGGPIQIRGDGTPYRSYLHAADLAIWLWTILFHGAAGRPYNVGSDADLSIAELARQVADAVNPAAEIRVACQPRLGQEPQRYVPAIDRARHELGLRVVVSLPDAIGRTAAWHRSCARHAQCT